MKKTMANLVDRYLHSVWIILPGEQREDILAELREDIKSQLDEREEELGRPLSEDEIAAVLKKRGHPSLVASRYLPQKFLIGPAIYPVYLFVLKLVLLWVIIPGFALTAPILYATAGNSAMMAVLTRLPIALFSAFGVITLIFVASERSWIACIRKAWTDWDPRTLPPLPALPLQDRLPRSTAIGEIIAGVFWTAVWLYLAGRGFTLDILNTHCVFPSAWRAVFWPELALLVAGIVIASVLTFQPGLLRAYSITRIVIDCGGILIAVVLFIPGAVLTMTAPQLSAESLVHAQYGVALGLRIAWVAISALLFVDMLIQIARLRRSRAKPPAWQMNSALSR